MLVNDTVLYLPWSPFPDNSTRNFGNVAFVLISSHDDALTSDSFGLEAPANQTLPVTVWSWIANSTLSGWHAVHHRLEVLMWLLR